MASIKPLDRDAIIEAADRSHAGKLMTVEEHNVLGGLGAAVAEVLTDEGKAIKFKRHGTMTSTVSSPRRRIFLPTTSWTRLAFATLRKPSCGLAEQVKASAV